MRRGRSLKDFRNKLLRNRIATVSERKKSIQQNILKAKNKNKVSREKINNIRAAKRRARKNKDSIEPGIINDYTKYPCYPPAVIGDFQSYHQYKYTASPVSVCHVIESVGLGGAQTMMLELVNGLNEYYGEYINNYVVCLHRKLQKPNKQLYHSYGITPEHVSENNFKEYCKKHNINIVLHHRIANSKCIRKYLPKRVKYVLLNHTWNFLYRIKDFLYCDFYVSVCRFLHKKTQWPDFIHPSRRIVILNGIENNYIKNLETTQLAGDFKTGRCHRLVPSKFNISSIRWMNNKVASSIHGFKHYLMGTNVAAKEAALKGKAVDYLGTIYNRNKKMSIIKALDAYFYETFQDEGASVAILESLACGVPVICKPLGGNAELVVNKVNGFIVADRSDYMIRMRFLASDKEMSRQFKQQVLSDFNNRLHIRHTACKYMQLFEYLHCNDKNEKT